MSGFRRFLDVVETVPEIVDAADAVAIWTNVKGSSVRYEDVSFHYSDDDYNWFLP
nr:hypothetical protein [[Ruminococcus] lactaris]